MPSPTEPASTETAHGLFALEGCFLSPFCVRDAIAEALPQAISSV